MGVAGKPTVVDVTEMHYVVSLNETIDDFTTAIMQRRHWSTNLARRMLFTGCQKMRNEV